MDGPGTIVFTPDCSGRTESCCAAMEATAGTTESRSAKSFRSSEITDAVQKNRNPFLLLTQFSYCRSIVKFFVVSIISNHLRGFI